MLCCPGAQVKLLRDSAPPSLTELTCRVGYYQAGARLLLICRAAAAAAARPAVLPTWCCRALATRPAPPFSVLRAIDLVSKNAVFADRLTEVMADWQWIVTARIRDFHKGSLAPLAQLQRLSESDYVLVSRCIRRSLCVALRCCCMDSSCVVVLRCLFSCVLSFVLQRRWI